MSLFEAEAVYRVSGDYGGAWVDTSPNEVQLDEAEIIDGEEDMLRPLHVNGVNREDIIISASFLFEQDGEVESKDVGYFITHFDDGSAVMVPGDVIERDPRRLLTPRLFYMLSGLDDGELEQFDVPSISAYIQQSR